MFIIIQMGFQALKRQQGNTKKKKKTTMQTIAKNEMVKSM